MVAYVKHPWDPIDPKIIKSNNGLTVINSFILGNNGKVLILPVSVP